MRRAIAIFAMLAAPLALSACTPPPSIEFTNASGQPVVIRECNGSATVVPPGEFRRFYWRYMRCYRTRAFTIERLDGTVWRYPRMPATARGLSAEDRKTFEAFGGMRMQARIDIDGTIILGHSRGIEAEFPQNGQPRGYPMKPTGDQ